MNAHEQEMSAALDAMLAGDLDWLSPQIVTRLEERLAHDPVAERRLAATIPPIEPLLRDAVVTPDAARWDVVWRWIDARTGSGTAGTVRRPRLVPRALWAAAACLAMALVWNVGRPPADAGGNWPVQWAETVEVESLEVPGTGTPFVFTVGIEEPISIIWVLPAES